MWPPHPLHYPPNPFSGSCRNLRNGSDGHVFPIDRPLGLQRHAAAWPLALCMRAAMRISITVPLPPTFATACLLLHTIFPHVIKFARSTIVCEDLGRGRCDSKTSCAVSSEVEGN